MHYSLHVLVSHHPGCCSLHHAPIRPMPMCVPAKQTLPACPFLGHPSNPPAAHRPCTIPPPYKSQQFAGQPSRYHHHTMTNAFRGAPQQSSPRPGHACPPGFHHRNSTNPNCFPSLQNDPRKHHTFTTTLACPSLADISSTCPPKAQALPHQASLEHT